MTPNPQNVYKEDTTIRGLENVTQLCLLIEERVLLFHECHIVNIVTKASQYCLANESGEVRETKSNSKSKRNMKWNI